jgi:hypothetical protein
MGVLVGRRSGPMLAGVLATKWKLLWVPPELNERGLNSPGESTEVVDMASKSGVPGSRYGFVVLMKVTGECVRDLVRNVMI